MSLDLSPYVWRSTSERRAHAIAHSYWNYVAFFEQTGLMKVGFSKLPRARFIRYVAEAKRHGLGDIRMVAVGNDMGRNEALEIERAMRQRFALFMQSGREWINGDEEMFLFASTLTDNLRFAKQVENHAVRRPVREATRLSLNSLYAPQFDSSAWLSAEEAE